MTYFKQITQYLLNIKVKSHHRVENQIRDMKWDSDYFIVKNQFQNRKITGFRNRVISKIR